MNFEPVYLRAIRQYCNRPLYLSYLPRELQIMIGKYLLYDGQEKFKITYYNNSTIKLSVHKHDNTGYAIYELFFNKNDQISLRTFVTKLISGESTVLSFKDEEQLDLHLKNRGPYVWTNLHYNNDKVAVTYSSIYRKENGEIITSNNEPEYMKLTMIWLKAFETILLLNLE